MLECLPRNHYPSITLECLPWTCQHACPTIKVAWEGKQACVRISQPASRTPMPATLHATACCGIVGGAVTLGLASCGVKQEGIALCAQLHHHRITAAGWQFYSRHVTASPLRLCHACMHGVGCVFCARFRAFTSTGLSIKLCQLVVTS